jgi:hypothetical protein
MGPDNSSFTDADFVQFIVGRHYEPKFGNGFVSFGNYPQFDIKFERGPSLEVKVDTKAQQTGNAAIEYWNTRKDKPSGILETTATLWIHIVPFETGLTCYEVDTKRLLRLCLETPHEARGGDNSASLLKLIPLLRLKAISSQVFQLNNKLKATV